MTTKQAIFDAIEQLPEQHLKDVLQYVQKLAGTLSPASNPPTQSSNSLADFIGAVSHGYLAANLDEEPNPQPLPL
ncbi:MAG: hypothetical protein RMY64_35400 [Nostoc sp. DedQUE08]|uniref:hypothetical protein n=1 Tax=unclassified Nostoc TaxID=2593658 RepID=UPI002AD2C4B1|nr:MULTISPECIES: hypothetical protein [unclassified Nostoc]MDZ8070844.1 hypothetical protein [Nostoc sp. DedQUE08]MDZ8095751.1 hypothetical protein [Nostoc sp. DedQUE05]